MRWHYRSAASESPCVRRALPARWGWVLAWTALLSGLAATSALWLQSQHAAQTRLDHVLEQRLTLVQARLSEAFSAYAAMLLAARGWLAGAQPQEESAWREFAGILDFERRSPGLRHLVYLEGRAQPVPEPAGVAVRYAAPALPGSWRGLDLAHMPGLHLALRGTDLSGTPSVSPVLRDSAADAPWLAVALRLDAGGHHPEPGYALAVIDVPSLMRWVTDATLGDVVLRLYDGAPSANRLLFRSPGESDPRQARIGTVRVEDRTWTVEVTPGTALGGAVAQEAATAILVAGTAVSLLLFVSLVGLASGQARASLLALRMSDAARARARRFSELARHAPMGVFVADVHGEFRFVNERWRSLFGLSEEAAGGEGWASAVHLQDRQRMLEAWREAVQAQTPFQQDCRLLAPGAEAIHVSMSAVPERDEAGATVAWIGTCMDISARRRAELALTRANEELEGRVHQRTEELEHANARLGREFEERRRAEREREEILQRQAALLHSIPDMAWLKDRQLRFLAVNERVAALLGVPVGDIVGHSDADFMAPEVAGRNREEDLEVLRTGRTLRLDEMGRYGTQQWFEVVKSPVLDEHGAVIGVAGVARDISERKRDEEVLRASNARLHALADELHLRAQARAAMNELGNVLGACTTLESGRAALARQIETVFPEGGGRLYWLEGGGEVMRAGARWGAPGSAERLSVEQCQALRDGRAHHVPAARGARACAHLTRIPLAGAVCVPLRVSGVVAGLLYWEASALSGSADEALNAERDSAWRQWACAVSEYLDLALSNLALRQTLQIQARHDPLTDLFNRRYMEEALERELRRAERSRRPMGVIMADLDHFKRYNDTLGHEAGDRLLVGLAECLRAQVRAGDIVCRYGGEEFLVILPEASLELVTQRAEELRMSVARHLAVPDESPLPPVTMSLGVALYPAHAQSADELVRAADEALYRAKRNGRDRVEIARMGAARRPQRPSRSASSSSR